MQKISLYGTQRTTNILTDRLDYSADLGGGLWQTQYQEYGTLTNNLFGAVQQVGAFTSLGASIASKASMNIATGIDKVTPLAGDLWYNGTELNFRDGITTVDLLAGGADTNFSNTNLLFTADKTHDLASFNASFSNVGLWTIGGNTQINGNTFLSGDASIHTPVVAGTALKINAGVAPNTSAGLVFTLNTGQERFKVTNEGATIITRENSNPNSLGTSTLSVYGSGNGSAGIGDDIARFVQANGGIHFDVGVGHVGIAGARSASHALQVTGNTNSTTYSVNGTAGATFSGAVTNITVVDGLVTAVS